MEKVDIWTESCEIKFGAIDRSDCMTLSAALNFFQEAAISHAENLGVGREPLAKTNQVWILSRMSVQINRRPKFREAVTVRTWPRGGEKLFAIRDFDIRDSEDIPVVQARSGWIIISLDKRRPLRPQLIIDKLPLNNGINALPAVVGLKERLLIKKITERKALYNEVDYNGHVNNVSYIRWIEDAIAPLLLEQAKTMHLDINYLSEVLPGETVELCMETIETTAVPLNDAYSPAHVFAFEGSTKREQKNVPAFRAELSF
ncbi:MAG: thioesterase [Treponema sp.]|nr:thioesterase [Treponema sp.]MCL2138928.1 thioesterase [Treponema sp.]